MMIFFYDSIIAKVSVQFTSTKTNNNKNNNLTSILQV